MSNHPDRNLAMRRGEPDPALPAKSAPGMPITHALHRIRHHDILHMMYVHQVHGHGALNVGSPSEQWEETMDTFGQETKFMIQSEGQLRQLFAPTHDLALQKCQTSLGQHARAFIARSPFLCLGTQGESGRADVSPRGDPPGFVKILDERTLAIPDRPGNNRLDSLSNIIANPNVGLLFLIPGFEDTLRINGRAALSTNPKLLESMRVNERTPTLAIIVRIEEVFFHCAKALKRSHIWDPAHRQNRQEMPSLVKMILDETTGAPEETEMRQLDEDLELAYRDTLY